MLEKRSSIAPGRVLLLKGKNLRTCCRRDNSGSPAPPRHLLMPPTSAQRESIVFSYLPYSYLDLPP